MLQDYNKYKVLQVFFDKPRKLFHLREISRETGLGLPSVINHVKKLQKEGLVNTAKEGSYVFYHGNRDNDMFRFYKKMDMLLRIKESGLLNYLTDLCSPNTVVLFGSASRGEDTFSSDIDLFIQAKEEKTNLKQFEIKLKRKVNLFFEGDIKKLSKELLNNIINGDVLQGYLKVV